jgi:hypothetical protein
VLRVPRSVWLSTLHSLRRCGAATHRECVVFWIGPASLPEEVDEAIHPRHSATRGHYEVDQDWLHGLWVDLGRQLRSIRCQVHIHAGSAFHSLSDDEGPVVHTPGFLSLVLPNYAQSDSCLDGAYLGQISGGSFREVRVTSLLVIHDDGS